MHNDPCVFPLLLVIASMLGERIGKESKLKLLSLSLTYVISIATTYAASGVISAYFGASMQLYAQNVFMIAGTSFIFLLLGLSYLGLYRLHLPKRWRQSLKKLNNFKRISSYSGIAVMGLIATLITAPCSAAPFIGALSFIYDTHNFFRGGISLFAMGFGVGTPLLIATAIGTQFLPKPGPWEKSISNFFGLAMAGIAIWLLARIIPNVWSITFYSLFILYIAVALWSFRKTKSGILYLFTLTLSLMMFIFGVSVFLSSVHDNFSYFRLM